MRRALPLLLAIAAFIVAALIWIGSSRVASHAFDDGSALNTSPTGLSLAYAYLGRQQGRSVMMLTTPLRADALAHNAVVIRVQSGDADVTSEKDNDEDNAAKVPLRTPKPLLSPAEDDFVRGGGRLILADSNPGGPLEVRNNAGRIASKVFPIWPGLDSVALPVDRGIAPRSLPRGMHTLFAANGETVVAQQTIGAGEVIVVSVPEVFANQNVASGHHIALLGALAGEGRPVYFDEVVHHIVAGDGALALLTEWRLGPLLVLAGVAALLAFWRNARRIGPAEDDDRDTRSDAVDLVNSLGALYGRSMLAAQSIVLYHEALARSVAAQTGLRGDALHQRVAALTNGARPPAAGDALAPDAFKTHLNTINTAFRTLERAARGGHDANHR
jgi:hypothetical protein